jgi:tetratricopeptide (TPR) repeat protein
MFRRSGIVAGFLPQIKLGSNKTDFFTSLWNKPQTRDEQVKEYVPEVLEESLEEQRAVLEESTSRDVIVELGNKILQEMDNKSPTPSIAPHLAKLLEEYGAKDVISQRPLSYLLYPNSSAMAAGEQAHELVSGFPDNFRAMIEEVERNGCSVKQQRQEQAPGISYEASAGIAASDGAALNHEGEGAAASAAANTEGEDNNNVDRANAARPKTGDVIMTAKEEYEPVDITMFVKVAAGMAMANLHCNDLRNAVRCVDAGIAHAKEASRLGGLHALKAGLLVHQKKFDEALESARLAINESGNVQGYLHGAYALRRLNRPEDAIELLEQGKEDHPMNTQFDQQISLLKKELKPALPASSSSSAAEETVSKDALTE